MGVLGCGPISQSAHFDACRKARNAELYAICDVAEDLVERMAAIHQPRITYTDYDQMLADPQVEAVLIAVADSFHVPLCLKAIEAGKPILVEKPLGMSVEECEELAGRARQSGLVVQVGNMKRFDPGITFARKFIREQMGEMIALKAWYCDSTFRYTMTDNLQPIPIASSQARRPEDDPKAERPRYYLLTHGSHLVDTARFLGGEITAVRARLVEKFGAYCWFVDLDFADGSAGHLDLTIAVRMEFHEGFQVYGEHGSVIGRTYLPWFFRSSEVQCFSVADGQFHGPLGADAHFYKLQVEGLAETLLHGAPQTGVNVEEGLAAMRALVAISRSLQSGQQVRLADVAGGV